MLDRNNAIRWCQDGQRIDSIWIAGGFSSWVCHFNAVPWVKCLVHRVRQVALNVCCGSLMWLPFVVDAYNIHLCVASFTRLDRRENSRQLLISWMSIRFVEMSRHPHYL